MRTHYAHPVDTLRKFNPQLTMQNLRNNDYIGNDDVEKVLAAIEGAESEFDTLTRNPFREVRVGTPDHPETWEVQDSEMYRTEYGVKIWLDNRDIHPIDPGKGDAIQMRQGKNHWDDITNEEGTKWEMNTEKGWIRVFSRYRRSAHRQQLRDMFMRITYRHGAPGGRHHKAGQTELSAAVTDVDSALPVEDPQVLQRNGVLFVGGDEYVSASGWDLDAGTVDVARGIRGTEAQAHDAGTTVHYCPLQVREAVACKSAKELLRYEDWVDELIESGGYSARDKMEDWTGEWESALDKHSEVRVV